MIPVTYGYARVSKTDHETRNLPTQLRILEEYGVREELVYQDVASGRSYNREGWAALMGVVRDGDTIVAAWLDRFSRNFEDAVAVQADLTRRNIAMVAIREGIDTRDSSSGAKYYRHIMLATAQLQRDSTSERVRAGQARGRAEGRLPGRKPAMSPDQIAEGHRMLKDGYTPPQIASIFRVHPKTVRKWLGLV